MVEFAAAGRAQGEGRNTSAVGRFGRCGGCHLYARMRRAGLTDLRAFPALITLDDPKGPIWRYRENHVQLTLAEMDAWHSARQTANEEGLLMQAHALHCAVATKPK